MKRLFYKSLAICISLIFIMMTINLPVYAEDSVTGYTKITDANTKVDIEISGLKESGLTISLYKIIDVNYGTNGPSDPPYSWDETVLGWLADNTSYSEYVVKDEEGNTTDEVGETFSSAMSENSVAATFYDWLSNKIRTSDETITAPYAYPAPDDASYTVTESTKAGDDESNEYVYTFSSCEMGQYLVLIEGGVRVYQASVVNLVPVTLDNEDGWYLTNPEINIKSSYPTIEKKIVENGTDYDKANYNIGDTVSFKLTSTIPTYPADSIDKKYWIGDKLSDGLTLDSDSITVTDTNGNEITSYEIVVTDGATKATLMDKTTEVSFVIKFEGDNYDQIKSLGSLIVTYNATLNSDAVIGPGTTTETDSVDETKETGVGNPNTAYLDYTNNPYEEGSYKEVEDKVKVYTYEIDVLKVDADNTKTALTGAEFKLYKYNDNNEKTYIKFTTETDPDATDSSHKGKYYKVNSDSDSGTERLVVGNASDLKGYLYLYGLDEGTYYLEETKAADGGYVTNSNPIKIVIKDADSYDDLDGVITYSSDDDTTEDGIAYVVVTNSKNFTLPTTGGMGTAIFATCGILFVAGGIVVLVVVARKNRENK